MKRPYDFLFTDRVPIVVLEKAVVTVRGGCVISATKAGKTTIPAASIAVLVLAEGCSISADAARMCAKHDCYIAFSRGKLNVHSVWHAGRHHDPRNICRQANIFSSKDLKLKAAKLIVSTRMKKEGATDEDVAKAMGCSNHAELLSQEAQWAKRVYSNLRGEFSSTFRRKHDSIAGENGRISLLNNLLYNYITAVVLQMGLSPSMGFVHGLTRMGGLVFDVADVFKYELALRPAFAELSMSGKDAMYLLSDRLRANRCAVTKEMISLITEILAVE